MCFKFVPPNQAYALEREEAFHAKDRCGVILGGNGFFYGVVIEVHASGDYLKFDRIGRAKPQWLHRRDVFLYPQEPVEAIEPSHAESFS